MSKIAVLGASGFVGNRTVEIFSHEGIDEVRPIVRRRDSLQRWAELGLQGKIADALDASTLQEAFKGCDIVIHSVIGNPRLIRNTVVATYKAAQKAGVRRLVYLSTASVHSQAPKPGTDEDSPLSDRQPLAYNNAKVQAERKLLQLRRKGSTEVAILRPGIVFGVKSRRISGFAKALLAGTAYFVNEGKGICNSIYIDNLVHAIRLAMTASDADGQAFLVGDRETVTWADLYCPIAEALGIDWQKIPNIDCPTFTRTWKERFLETLRNSDLANVVASLLPDESKKAAKAKVMNTLQRPGVTQEMALLYQCQYKLPSRKAEKVLGYAPIVSFTEARDRTINWLISEGYSV